MSDRDRKIRDAVAAALDNGWRRIPGGPRNVSVLRRGPYRVEVFDSGQFWAWKNESPSIDGDVATDAGRKEFLGFVLRDVTERARSAVWSAIEALEPTGGVEELDDLVERLNEAGNELAEFASVDPNLNPHKKRVERWPE